MPFDEGTKRQVIMLRFILVLLLMMVAVVSKATLEDVIEEDVRSLREGTTRINFKVHIFFIESVSL